VTVADAAQRLGISKEAVRKRISRGTLRSDRDQDGSVRVYVPPSGTPSTPTTDALAAKDQTIAILQEQLREEREARRRADTLLARFMDQLPQLEAAESHEEGAREAAEGAVRASPTSAEPSAQNASEQRPWWRRMLGG
jgi:excisionase family DNA binding protein